MSVSDPQTEKQAPERPPLPPSRPGPHPPGTPGPGQSNRRSLLELALIVAVVVVAAYATHTVDLLVVIVALVIMIMVHEFGHFITAKWSHMKVTEYFLGFGPRLWSVRKGETEYGIKAVPAGGYVKVLGMSNLEEVDPADEARTYRQQSFPKRLVVVCAGSAMHGIMAFLLVWAYFSLAGQPSSSVVQVQAIAPLAHNVDPARSAGVRPGDVIVKADGKAVVSENALIEVVEAHVGEPVSLVVRRQGATRHLVVTPVPMTVSGKTVGRIGVELTTGNLHIGALRALGRSGVALGQTVTASFAALGHIFSPSGLTAYWHDLTNAKAAQASEHSTTRIESIYGAVRTGVQGAEAGWGGLVAVLVSINVFVGIMNMLPMLPLDGGHVAVAVYERIRSRRGRRYHADVRKLAPVAYAFILFLGFIVVSALYLDITHPLANPFH